MYIMSSSPKGKPYRKRNPRNRRNKRSLRRRWVNLRIGSLKNRRGGARPPAHLRRATKGQPAKRQPAKGRSAKKQKTRKRTSFAVANRTRRSKKLSDADRKAVLYKGREVGSIRRDADTIFKRILSSVAKGGALAKILVPTYPKKILQHIVDDDKIADKGAAFREVLRGTSLKTYATWERRALQNVRKGGIKNKLKSIFVQLRRYTRFQATSPEERAAARSPKTKGKPALANIHEDHFSAPVAAPAAVKKQSTTLSYTPAALRAAQPIRPAFGAQGKSAVSATPSAKPSLLQKAKNVFTRKKRKGSKAQNGTRKRALVKPVKPAAEIELRPFKKSSAAPAAAPQDVAANARAIAGVSGLTDDKLAQNIRSTEKSIQTLRNKKKSDLNDRLLAIAEQRLRVLRQESNKRNPAPPAPPAAPAAPAPPPAPAAPAPLPAPPPAPPAPPAAPAPPPAPKPATPKPAPKSAPKPAPKSAPKPAPKSAPKPAPKPRAPVSVAKPPSSVPAFGRTPLAKKASIPVAEPAGSVPTAGSTVVPGIPIVVAPGAPGSSGASSSKRDRDPIKWGETDVTASPTKKKMTIRIGVDNGVVFFDTNARQAGNTATETVKSVKKVLRGGRKKRTRKKKRTKRRRKRV